ncbi:MAG: ParB/RepB/Spo0J family partition protein [Clostridia bacterium]|nr:ParB/RepB/Spo0J family partition protein [Clostridia bacterium]
MRYSESPTVPAQPLGETLPLDRIRPRPTLRSTQDSATLTTLAESIRRFGLLRPITVRRLCHGRYVVISGNRRLMACRMLGWGCIPAHVLREDTAWQPADSLLDALRQKRLHYLEEAGILSALHSQHRMPWADLAQQLQTDARQLQTQAGLAALEDDVKAMLLEEGAPMHVALPLLRLPAGESRTRIALAIVRQRLSARDAALLIAAELRSPEPHKGTFQERKTEVYKSDIPAAGEDDLPPATRRVIRLIRDHRLYLNAIRDIAGQMQQAGFAATVAERQVRGQVEMVIRVPARKRRMDRYQSM